MKCRHCGSDGRIQVQTTIEAPGDMSHNFSKKNLRSKEVFLRGVMWETQDFICGNPACGKVEDGYGNYVTNLKKENQKLKNRIRYLEGKKEDDVNPQWNGW